SMRQYGVQADVDVPVQQVAPAQPRLESTRRDDGSRSDSLRHLARVVRLQEDGKPVARFVSDPEESKWCYVIDGGRHGSPREDHATAECRVAQRRAIYAGEI